MTNTITQEAIALHAKEKGVSFDIARCQLEYAARPFFVRWVDSHCSVPSRFNTFDEAFDHVQLQWHRIRARAKSDNLRSSLLQWGRIEGPNFSWTLRELLLVDDVSSY